MLSHFWIWKTFKSINIYIIACYHGEWKRWHWWKTDLFLRDHFWVENPLFQYCSLHGTKSHTQLKTLRSQWYTYHSELSWSSGEWFIIPSRHRSFSNLLLIHRHTSISSELWSVPGTGSVSRQSKVRYSCRLCVRIKKQLLTSKQGISFISTFNSPLGLS